MSKVVQLKRQLQRGKVYRRSDLASVGGGVDRYLDALVEDGTLQKLAGGLYYYPEQTAFGPAVPNEEMLVEKFLKDKDFLVTTPNLYNSLGVGTTQLYNTRVVYNHKRHGAFVLGGLKFEFRVKPKFPKKVSAEFLLVDLVNNLETLAEDKEEVLEKVKLKVHNLDKKKLAKLAQDFGKVRTKKLVTHLLEVS
jgi:hypothetical protein